MSVKLITSVGSPAFSSELDVFQLESSENPVDITVSDSSGKEIFNTTLRPLASGSLPLYGFGEILDSVLDTKTSEKITVSANGNIVFDAPVIRSAVALSLPASEWVRKRFLTSMTDERDTNLSCCELLSCYIDAQEECSVTALYLTDEDAVVPKVFSSRSPQETVGKVLSFDVSPSNFADETIGRLVHYTVAVGERKQRFRVLLSPPPRHPRFIFRNNFGCWETLSCSGVVSVDPQYTRSSAMVNGRYVAYAVEETDRVTASTGVLRFGAERLVRDFARSKSVYLLNDDGTQGEQVVVTDCSVKDSNADDFTPQFSFTYRLAKKGAADLDRFKVFDLSFDETYE